MLDQLTIFGIISLLNFLTCVFIGTFLYVRNKKSPVNVSYCIFDYCVAFYAFFYFLWQSTSNLQWGIIFFKWCIFGVVLINSAFIYFAFVVLNIHQKSRRQLYLIHAINAFFCFASLYLFYDDWKIKYSYGLWPIPSKIFHFYIAWWFLQVIYAFFLIHIKGVARSSGKDKKQFQWIFWATLIAYAGGATNWLVWYDINFPPYLNSGIAIYTIVLAYAIFRHQLLGIDVIIKKTLVFAGLFGMVMIVVAVVTTLTQFFISQYVAANQAMATAVSIFLALFLYDPARKFLVNVTDRYLFQKKEDIKIILNRLSKDIITILDIDQVAKAILDTFQQSLRLESGAILLKDENGDSYKVLDAFGLKDKNLRFEKFDPFLKFLADTEKTVNLENAEEREALPTVVREKLQELRAVIAIPLFLHIDLIGVLLLGKKKSDQEFTAEEIDYFPTVASQVAIALSNARLYEILKKSQIDFAQQAKMAAIGTLSAGISHEIKNPLNHIRVGISMLKLNKKHGILDKLDREHLEEEIFKTLDILDENVTRANAVIERLSGFAKKPKEVKIEPVDLRKAVDTALSFLKEEFNYYNIEVQRQFPEHFPLIEADLHTLEDVFLNLLVNARHAIVQRGAIAVTGTVRNGELEVAIKDTGKGIPKDNLDKIFDPFFTTKDVSRNPDKSAIKGSGLGLFIVREFIQRSGGRITVESEVGQGTTFHLIFPEVIWAKNRATAR